MTRKHTKRCSTLLIICCCCSVAKSCLILCDYQRNANQNATCHHLISQNGHNQKLYKQNCQRGVEKREPYYTVGGNVSWYRHYGEQYGGFLRKLKTELPHDTSVSLLGKYLEKTIILKDTGTPTFIAALLQHPRHGSNRNVH